MPILPVSSAHSIDSLPPTLRAVVLVEALSSFPQHKPASVYAWRLLKEERVGERALDRPKLSGLATAVVELGTTLDQRGDYGLLAKVRQLSLPPSVLALPRISLTLLLCRPSRTPSSSAFTSTGGGGRCRSGRSRCATGSGGRCGYMTHGCVPLTRS